MIGPLGLWNNCVPPQLEIAKYVYISEFSIGEHVHGHVHVGNVHGLGLNCVKAKSVTAEMCEAGDLHE